MDIKNYNDLDLRIKKMILKYDNIDISYLVRNHLISLIRTKNKRGNKELHLDKTILKRLIVSIITHSYTIFKRKPIWVFSNAERRKKIGDKYYDRVASLVSEAYPEVLFIENPVISAHKKPTKDIVLSDAIFFIGSFLFSKLYYKKKHLHIDDKLIRLAKEYNIQLQIEPLIKRFVGQYLFMRWYLKYVSNPKKVFSVYPNGYYGYNYAFKERNIPIIELQHGIIYPLHPSYNTILIEAAQKFKPDYIFTYGTKDKECLIDLNYVTKDNIFVVGSYGLWKIKKEKAQVSSYLEVQIDKNFRTALVVATTNDIQELYQWCLALEAECPELNILLLPRFQVTEFTNTKNVKVLDIHDTNIFETYQVADFVLTKNSTAALEALYMQVPTFIYDPNENSVYKKSYNYITSLNFINSIKGFKYAIENKSYKESSAKDVDQVYAEEVLRNFTNATELVNR